MRGNYCVLSEYHKCMLPPLTWMVGPTMNLINGTHHSCERRKHAFMVFREYLIIFPSMRDARHHILRNKLRSMNINQLTEKRRPYLNQLNSCVSVKSRPSWELATVSLVTDNWFVDLISKAVRNEGRLRETRLRERKIKWVKFGIFDSFVFVWIGFLIYFVVNFGLSRGY